MSATPPSSPGMAGAQSPTWPDIEYDAENTRSRYKTQYEERGVFGLVDEIIKDDLKDEKVRNASPLTAYTVHNLETNHHARIHAAMVVLAVEPRLVHALIEHRVQLTKAGLANPGDVFPTIKPQLRNSRGRPKKGAKRHPPPEPEDEPFMYGYEHTKVNGDPPSYDGYMTMYRSLLRYGKGAKPWMMTKGTEDDEDMFDVDDFDQGSDDEGDEDADTGSQDGDVDSQDQEEKDLEIVEDIDEWSNVGKPPFMNPKSKEYLGDDEVEEKRRDQGWRRYLPTWGSIRKFKVWLKAFKVKLDRVPVEHRADPLPWAFTEVGWALEWFTRKGNHDGHNYSSANPLMNLVEAAFASQVDNGNQYRMRFQLLVGMFDRDHVAIAEHLLSRLCSSYHFLGGMNRVIGGIQTTSADKLSRAKWAGVTNKRWNDLINIEQRWQEHLKKMKDEWRAIDLIAKVRAKEADHPALIKKEEDVVQEYQDLKADMGQSDKAFDDTAAQVIDAFERNMTTLLEARKLASEMEGLQALLQRATDLEVTEEELEEMLKG